MKRTISVVLALAMMFSMLTTVSARTLNEATDFVPNPMELELGLQVLARESGTNDAYASEGLAATRPLTEYGVDYKATLDMSPVRSLLDEQFIAIVLAADNQAITEYNAGIISTTINVVIDFPANTIFKNNIAVNTTGVLDAGTIFSERSRSLNGNKLTITYVNRENLTVADLTANRATYLRDIAFALENTAAFATVGTHKVAVTLSGSTQVAFATKTQTVNYVGGSSHIVTYSEDVIEHVLTVVPLKPATCVATGSTEGVICSTHNSYGGPSGCGALGTRQPEVLPMIPHTPFHVAREEATCNATGMLAHYTCSFCKKDFTDAGATNEIAHDDLIIAKTGIHNLTTITGVAATCTKTGLTNGRKCLDCGAVTVRQETIPVLAHTEATVAGHAATCTETGLTNGKECSVCHVVTVSQQVIPATGHNFGEWRQTVAPTESSVGSKERTCQNGCGTTEVVEIPKLTHTHVIDSKMDVITLAPTCTTAGTKQQYCACGTAVGDPIEIPATGHTLSHISAIAATCSTTGTVEHYLCAVCSGTYRDNEGKTVLNSTIAPIDKHNHGGNEVTISPVAPTCVTKGLTEGKKCKACNKVTVEQTLVDMIPHQLINVAEFAATCEVNGIAEHKHCVHCNKDFLMDGTTEKTIDELAIAHLGHKYGDLQIVTPATELAEGLGELVCEHDNNHKISVTIAKLQHTHNEIVDEIIEEATCTHTGLKRKVWACCHTVVEDQENIVIPTRPHTTVLIPSVDPTCQKEGLKAHYQCTECKKLFDVTDQTKEIAAPEVLDKTLHDFRQQNSSNAAVIIKKCIHCNEVIKIEKENTTDEAEVKDHGGFKDEKDEVREEKLTRVEIETQIKIKKNDDVSVTLYQALPEGVSEEKLVLDIVVEKNTTHTDEHTSQQETEVERIVQTEDLVVIEIKVPNELRSKTDFVIHRLHIDEDGTEHIERLLTTPNEFGEYIEISPSKNKVTMHVRRFSEYVLVGYDTVVNQAPESSSRPSATKTYTVTFNANGGTLVENVKVIEGGKVTAPETTRDGYVFDGWYKDLSLTDKFDFNTAIKMDTVLYAKWISESDIPTAPADFDKFIDLGGYEWAKTAINYLAYKGVIKGVTDITYEPGIGIKRGDVALLMIRQFGLTSDSIEMFEDVPADSYYAEACRIGKAHGVLLGVNEDNTLYEPERTILREEMAALIVRSLVTMGHIENPVDTDVSKYTDADKIESYALPYVAYLTKTGIVQGNPDGTFRPKDYITRAEAAQVIYNLYKLDVEGLID